MTSFWADLPAPADDPDEIDLDALTVEEEERVWAEVLGETVAAEYVAARRGANPSCSEPVVSDVEEDLVEPETAE